MAIINSVTPDGSFSEIVRRDQPPAHNVGDIIRTRNIDGTDGPVYQIIYRSEPRKHKGMRGTWYIQYRSIPYSA